MDRRAFLGSLGLLVVPVAAEAQPPRTSHRIGWLTPATEEYSRGFREALRALGYDGQTVVLEPRSAGNDLARLPRLARELVHAKVDVIVAVSPPAILAAKQATDTIPIVMAYWGAEGLIESGIVASFARPGSNVTGVYMLAAERDAKRLELLLQAVPKARRVGVLDPQAPVSRSRRYRESLKPSACSFTWPPWEQVGTRTNGPSIRWRRPASRSFSSHRSRDSFKAPGRSSTWQPVDVSRPCMNGRRWRGTEV